MGFGHKCPATPGRKASGAEFWLLDADGLKGDLFNLIYYRLDFFQTEE